MLRRRAHGGGDGRGLVEGRPGVRLGGDGQVRVDEGSGWETGGMIRVLAAGVVVVVMVVVVKLSVLVCYDVVGCRVRGGGC